VKPLILKQNAIRLLKLDQKMKFDNSTFIVTGGASGLGEATVRRFHGAGANVVIADLNAERGSALAVELGARCVCPHRRHRRGRRPGLRCHGAGALQRPAGPDQLRRRRHAGKGAGQGRPAAAGNFAA
jgi:NAD(P)-dependent dehydrogenase (short-subunit alcohol dehydrogenase family)